MGVILNLALWFAVHTLFREVRAVRLSPLAFDMPVLASLSLPALVLAALAALAIFRFKVGMIPTLLATAAVGAALALSGISA